MGDLARFSIHGEDRLYEIFGVDAEILIDHAWGYEPCGMAEIKSYKPSTNSISEGQVLTLSLIHIWNVTFQGSCIEIAAQPQLLG